MSLPYFLHTSDTLLRNWLRRQHSKFGHVATDAGWNANLWLDFYRCGLPLIKQPFYNKKNNY